MTENSNPPERPRAEPEIIPPDQTGGSNPPWQKTWQKSWRQDGIPDGMWRTQHVFVMRPGPFGFALIMFALAVIAAAVILTAIGAFLIWIPIVALFAASAAVYRFIRR